MTHAASTDATIVNYVLSMGKIVVAGGGMCGMAAAMMLADDGHEVTVIERDPEPPPPDLEGAFGEWDRRSVAQFGLAHWLHARGTSILRDQLPAVYRRLDENGGYHFNLVTYLLSMMPDAEITADDARFDLVTGRRSTIEWAMASAAHEHPGVTLRRGEAIGGLLADSADGAPPHITGVRLQSGEELHADLVVDTTGRRSPTPDWLADVGACPPAEHAEDSGFAYYGRYFRSSDGSMPAVMGPLLAPYGSFSILTLPADNDTWAVTLYGLSDDKSLRSFRDPDVYERVIRACPMHAHWLDGQPITELKSMAGVVDRHRQFVVDGEPVATGILTVGDAASCTNPSLGRGISLGLMHVEVMRACVAEHLDDPHALALSFHERSEREITPWHEATTAIDRRRVNDMRTYRDGGTPTPTDVEKIADVMQAAVTIDPVITRGFGEIFSCLSMSEEVTARPGFLERVLDCADKVTLDPLPGPDREQLMELAS
ncbi:FAD-dependent oxidoreductase [Ilumatobacter sp.]|uniref:FAD-dependent oxidoreductase n=1 Tax=Ilumatobacter sp. TaxID=1967498 RepID=UPI003AF8FC60